MGFLEGIEPQARRRLLRLAEERTLADGERLVRQGELGRELFVVVDGALEAREGQVVRSVCGPGRVVGELAFLDSGARSLDLVARGRTRVLVFPHDPLRDALSRDAALKGAVLEGIATSQAQAMRRLTEVTAAAAPTEPIELDAGRFVPGGRALHARDGSRVTLSPIEARLLSYLAARPGQVIPYQTLLEEVWGYSQRVSSRTVYATIHRLRPKVEVDASSPRHIVAVSGVGYRFDP